MPRIARITTYLKGQELSPDLMTPEETDALVDCVLALVPTYGSRLLFDVDTPVDEEGHLHLFLVCREETPTGSRWVPIPKEWATKTIAFSNGRNRQLFGEKLPVTPRPDGRTPWDFVEVKLTDADDE